MYILRFAVVIFPKYAYALFGILGLIILMPSLARSGSLTSPAGAVDPASAMYTIEDIFNRLGSTTTVTKRAGAFTEPSAVPASTGHSLDDVMALVDIRARVMKTGQTTSFSGNDDGDLERGITWPNPRFTIDGAGTGTVVDNLTTLIWLKDASCLGSLSFSLALTSANGLATGSCGLSDGSAAGDWRLPNINELYSLIDFGFNFPALPNTAGTGQWSAGDPFINVGSGSYRSSTTFPNASNLGMLVDLGDGETASDGGKGFSKRVWPVRGGQ